jgi:hypothetical protein
MDRPTLERRQVWIYLASIAGAFMVGSIAPGIEPHFEALLWPVPAVPLYATLVQVPLLHVRDAFRDPRFVPAILLGVDRHIPAVLPAALRQIFPPATP